jgi:hypothetical protein
MARAASQLLREHEEKLTTSAMAAGVAQHPRSVFQIAELLD